MTPHAKCTICGNPIKPQSDGSIMLGPFCSQRCRDVDLSRWFSESYPVPVETDRVASEELMEEMNAAEGF